MEQGVLIRNCWSEGRGLLERGALKSFYSTGYQGKQNVPLGISYDIDLAFR